MEQDLRGAYDDQVVEAAFLHSKRGCYFIGPFARRVSFASQQFRAIDLVEALAAKGKLSEQSHVAVIGAGLSGLTAVAALLGRKCKVDLYEELPGVLERQRGATHRLVHPTIARWPMERLSLTTELPFFDWGVSACSDIMENLAGEWRRHFDPDLAESSNLHVFAGRKVISLISTPTVGRPAVKIETSPKIADPAVKRRKYELVIVTTGYGSENALEGRSVTSYWSPDELERRRAEPARFAIAGCGDGGLIDALRIVHDDFNGGWLAFAVAERLENLGEDAKILSIIREAEHDAMMMWKSLACAAARPTEERPLADSILRPLFEAYNAALGELPGDVRQLLEASLGHTPQGKVWLIAPEAWPIALISAPIHKLMVMHAIEEGQVEWKKGSLEIENGEYVYRDEHGSAAPLEGRDVIERRGAGSGLTQLVTKQELVSLRLRQFMLADRIDIALQRCPAPPFAYPAVECGGKPTAEFISSRYPAAAALLDSLDPRFALDADEDGFSYVRVAADAAPPTGCGASVGVERPPRLFGKIDARDADEMASYDAFG